MKQYYEIKSQYPNMILFFRLGDFYEIFDDDAIKTAPILGIVLTQRSGVYMCGVPYHAVNSYIKKLIEKGLKIAVCEQLKNIKSTKSIIKREVTKVITPGTVLDYNLLDPNKNNFLMSINVNKNTMLIACAVADISTGDFFTFETTLEFIKTEIFKYNPGEIIMSTNKKNKHILKFISNLKIPISNIDKSFFDIRAAKQIIKDVFNNDFLQNESKNIDIIRVCGALLYYVKKMQPQSIGIFSSIKHIITADCMYLDDITIKNLELFNQRLNGNAKNSLFTIMNSSKTSMGIRTLRQWLLRPLFNVSKIIDRQKIVNFFIKNHLIRNNVCEQFKTFPDIERIIAKICSGIANPNDLLLLKNSLKSINNIFKTLKFVENDIRFNLPKTRNIDVINKISYYLSDGAFNRSLKDGNIIKNGINTELDNLRIILIDAKTHISNLEIKEKTSTGINNLKIGYTSVFGYYIEVSKSNISFVPKHYIRKQTIANGERYITDELKILEEKILFTKEKILNIENDLFNTLNNEISFFTGDILRTSRIVAELDILLGFAMNALEYNYVCPNISNTKNIDIKNGRHPVIEKILKDGEFTSNDIVFNKSSRIILLTGPNMSGKSTYLRQTALIIIMAQMGSFVPAYSANIGLVDRIFTRIGAGDNIAYGESTFMVEMLETANILNQYSDRSLIILDEVGRGTSTFDGMSIAWAIIEFFSNSKKKINDNIKVFFTTHYFELTNLSKICKGVVNYKVNVKEWKGKIIFLHKIVKGKSDKSYGIHVAKIAGIPNEVIERSYKILDKFKNNTAIINNVQ
ncbi:MAG: DNA mismatch repair protein MutS [Endomicrobium sp.]|nr:DNA mismatch repair protein MutS [Endomicrobium sp.]